MYICQYCESEYTETHLYASHVRWCTFNTDIDNKKVYSKISISLRYKNILKSISKWKDYYKDPVTCFTCNKQIDWFSRKNKFCSKSCSAINSNKNRPSGCPTRIKGNEQRKTKLQGQKKPQNKCKYCDNPVKGSSLVCKSDQCNILYESKFENTEIRGDYTRLYVKTCNLTGNIWMSPNKYARRHPYISDSLAEYRYNARFKFSLSDYPEWFSYASQLIDMHGWYSASNRGNNKSGCSRDHMYSVSDGFKNNVDVRLISHPANCKIITHKENQHKNKNSSISYEDLLHRISVFESTYGPL